MKILNNNKGYSLIELIAGIPLTALVFVIFAIGIIHFTTTFKEVRLYTQLQQDLFDTIETMRHGYLYEGVNEDEGLIGLTTAKEVKIGTSRNSIRISPLVTNISIEDLYYIDFHLNDDLQIEIDGKYGLIPFPERKLIFPSTPTKFIAGKPQFTIENSRDIWSVIHTDANGNPLMIHIKLVGHVRFREKLRHQSNEDDVRKNTRTITYETSVFLGNSHANAEE